MTSYQQKLHTKTICSFALSIRSLGECSLLWIEYNRSLQDMVTFSRFTRVLQRYTGRAINLTEIHQDNSSIVIECAPFQTSSLKIIQ